MFALVSGVYWVHAETDDKVTHRAKLFVRSPEDLAIYFGCCSLVIDGHGGALSHLRKPEDLVDCMTCLAAERAQ